MAAASASEERGAGRSRFLAWAGEDDPECIGFEQTGAGAEGGRPVTDGPGGTGGEAVPAPRRHGTGQGAGAGRTENGSQVSGAAFYWANCGTRTGEDDGECPIIALEKCDLLRCTDAYAPRKDPAYPAGVLKPRRNAVWRLHDALGRRDGLQRGVAHLPNG